MRMRQFDKKDDKHIIQEEKRSEQIYFMMRIMHVISE